MKNSNRSAWLLVITGLIVVCLCFATAGAGLTYFALQASSQGSVAARPGGLPQSSGHTAAPATAPTVARTPVAANSSINSTYQNLVNAVLPREDLANIAVRFKGVPASAAQVSCPTLSKGYEIGATRAFTLSNQDDNTQFVVTARLEYKTPHAYMWVQTEPERVRLNTSKLKQAADDFENKIYPTNRAFFGNEESPGVDCDVHVHVLHVTGVGRTVGGYFSSVDSYSTEVRSDSNEGQMFIMHAERGYNGSDPGSESYMSTLAHEFQHMISFNQTHAPSLWLEEGAAQLAERLNGYADTVTSVYDFAAVPETQLNTWGEGTAGGNSAHYGGGYLFWSYLYDRFGEDTVKKLARNPERSPQALMKVLADNGVKNPETGKPFTFEEVFSDFVVANFVGRQKIEPGGNRFNYATIDVPPMTTRNSLSNNDLPFSVRESVPQFGTHYYELSGNKPVSVTFAGATIVPILPMQKADGTFWWSNRADQSNSRLTREIDLTGVQSATLNFSTWFRMEEDYDYAYVSVSEDGGVTWKLLEPPACTTDNPQNANLGCGYNGASGGDDTPQWVNQTVDLTPMAGKKFLLRFEAITDAGVNREGFAIDNISIPEIDWKDDGSSDAGWQSEGWSRVENTLPQFWQVQAIVTGRDGKVSVQRMMLKDNTGALSIDLGGNARSAVLAISPLTQVTTVPAAYDLQIK
jgi:hypothetical protein